LGWDKRDLRQRTSETCVVVSDDKRDLCCGVQCPRQMIWVTSEL